MALWLTVVAEVCEGRDAIRLRPDPRGSWAGDVPIVNFNIRTTVERDHYPSSLEVDLQRVPGVLRHRSVYVLDGVTVTVHGVVQRHIPSSALARAM